MFKAPLKFAVIKSILVFLLFFIIGFGIYANTLESPFVLDDKSNIQYNPGIRLTQLTLNDIKRAGFEEPSSKRPVSKISFALNYYFHKYNLFGYHLVNILIHIATGIFLYLFIEITLEIYPLTALDRSGRWIPFFTALIWLVHPIQTQSVTYIVQRMNSMSAMFYILSLLLYAKGRTSRKQRVNRIPESKEEPVPKAGLFSVSSLYFSGSALACILALGAKQNAVMLPVFIFLYEWYFLQDLDPTWLKRHLFYFAVPLAFILFICFLYLGDQPLESIRNGYRTRDFTMLQRVMTEFRVVIFYISLILFPHPSRLNLEHDFSLSFSLINPASTLFSMVLIAGLLVLALHLAKKERLVSFCILWFFGNLIIESSVVGLEIIFEHRTYLPSMFMSLMAVFLFYRYISQGWLKVVVLCVIAMVFSFWTYSRNSVWQNEVSLWRDCVEKSPNKARPRNNLGLALEKEGRIDEAINHYLEALRINPDHEDAHNNLGIVLEEQGDIEEAIKHYLEALRIKPNLWDTHFNLGVALDKQGRADEAIEHYLETLRIKPGLERAHYNLGNALSKQGRMNAAIKHYLEALRIKPDYVEARYNLGNAFFRQGNIKEAIVHFQEALRIKPDSVRIKNNIKNALMMQHENQ